MTNKTDDIMDLILTLFQVGKERILTEKVLKQELEALRVELAGTMDAAKLLGTTFNNVADENKRLVRERDTQKAKLEEVGDLWRRCQARNRELAIELQRFRELTDQTAAAQVPTSEKESPVTLNGDMATVFFRAHNANDADKSVRDMLDSLWPNLAFVSHKGEPGQVTYKRIGRIGPDGMYPYKGVGKVKPRERLYCSQRGHKDEEKPKEEPEDKPKGLDALFPVKNEQEVFVNNGVATMEKPEPKGYGEKP